MADPATGLTPPLAPRAHAYSENAKRTQPSVGVKYYVVVWTKCPVFNGLAQELLWCVPETGFDIVESMMAAKNGAGTKPVGVPIRYKKLAASEILNDVAVGVGYQKIHRRAPTEDDLCVLGEADMLICREILNQSAHLFPFAEFATRHGVCLRPARVAGLFAGRAILLFIMLLVLCSCSTRAPMKASSGDVVLVPSPARAGLPNQHAA